jgi:hypothetical protein
MYGTITTLFCAKGQGPPIISRVIVIILDRLLVFSTKMATKSDSIFKACVSISHAQNFHVSSQRCAGVLGFHVVEKLHGLRTRSREAMARG